MYFKNVTVYQITRDIGMKAENAVQDLAELVAAKAFKACGSQNSWSFGWVPPLHAAEGEDMVLAGSGRVMLTLKHEEKILPSASVSKLLKERIKAVEKADARKVGAKEKSMLRDEIVKDLLPKCLSKETFLNGYLSIDEGLLVIDTPTAARAEEFCRHLRATIGSLPVVPVQSNSTFERTMTDWFYDSKAPDGFLMGWAATLKDEEGGETVLRDQDLFSEEVRAHIVIGQRVKNVRLRVEDTVEFALTGSFQLKSLKWAPELKDQSIEAGDDLDPEDILARAAARADADFVLMAGELDKLLLQLFKVMDVYRQQDEMGPDPVNVLAEAHAKFKAALLKSGAETVTISCGEHSTVIKAGAEVRDPDLGDDGLDSLFQSAVNFISETGKVSISALQRNLRTGYNRSARIIEQLEEKGYVSAPAHNGTRKVLGVESA